MNASKMNGQAINLKLILTAAILVSAWAVSSQTIYVKSKKAKNQTPAEFPGGQDSLFCFLENSWNQELLNQVDSGTVVVEFKIDLDGKVDSVMISSFGKKHFSTTKISVSDEKLKNELKVAFEKMPNWIPEKKKGNPINSRRTIMLNFPYDPKCN